MSQDRCPPSARAATHPLGSRHPHVETYKSKSVPLTEPLYNTAERHCPSNISFEKHNFFLEELCPSDSDDDDKNECPDGIPMAREASTAMLHGGLPIDRRRPSDASMRLEEIAVGSASRQQSFSSIGSLDNSSAPGMMSSSISITGQIEDEIIERAIREGKLVRKVEEEGSRHDKLSSSLGSFARKRGSGASSQTPSVGGGRCISFASNLSSASLSSMAPSSSRVEAAVAERQRGSGILEDIERALRDLNCEEDDDHGDEEAYDAALSRVILSTGGRGNATDPPVRTFESPTTRETRPRRSSSKRPKERRNWS